MQRPGPVQQGPSQGQGQAGDSPDEAQLGRQLVLPLRLHLVPSLQVGWHTCQSADLVAVIVFRRVYTWQRHT